MAQQRTVVLVDDLDGSQAQHTVAFSLDGQQYEIDLSAQNTERLHAALAPFMTKARITTGPEPKVRRTGRPRTAAQPKPAAQTEPQDAAPPAAVRPAVVAPPAAVAPPAVVTPAAVTPPVEVTPAETAAAASRPPVPAALFSDTTQQVASRAVTGLKPQTTELFSPAS